MLLKKIILISAVLMAFLIFGCGKGKKGDQKSEYAVPVPISLTNPPIITIYGCDWGLPSRVEREREWIFLSVWPDGKVIWSKDELNGGPPYFTGNIDSQKIDVFFQIINNKKINESSVKFKNYYGPDSAFIKIVVVKDANYIEMSSWHELYNANPNLVVTSFGIESLNGRSRQEVLSQQPKEYQEFLNVWSELRQASKSLIPEEGQPAGDIKFELKRVIINDPPMKINFDRKSSINEPNYSF